MPYNKTRIKIILLAITALFVMVGTYVAYLKITMGKEYEQRALRQYTSRYDVQIYPMRGSIVDRNMKELAVSSPIYNVILDPVVLNENHRNEEIRQESINKTLTELSERFRIPREELEEYMQTDSDGQLLEPKSYVKVAKGISRTEAEALKALELKGIWLEDDSKRSYPFGQLASNVVGFVRGDTSWGLESYYDDYLKGEAGRAFVTYTNSATPVINKVPAKNGNTVITTINSELQEVAENVVRNAVDDYHPDNAAMIVMNPKTGEILAMAMYPTFDLTDPTIPIYLEDEEFQETWELMDDEQQMQELYREWKNYCISSAFEPGSIFKPVVVSAALDEGIISETDTFTCGGAKTMYDVTIRCHYTPGHGTQTVEEVLANSCNVAMMDIAARMGPDLFYKHFRNFGFGEKTEIDLPGEESAKNLVYTEEMFNNPINLATSSFGQGSACTPIQALNAFAAIINGGSVMKPYIVSQVVDENGNIVLDNKPVEVKKILSNETSDEVRKMMQSVVEYGTGKNAKIPGYSIGGKTGTAEQGVRNKVDHTHTFIAYLPVENPEIVALALLDRPGTSEHGSATTTPMLKEFMEEAIRVLGIQPSNEEEVEEDLFLSEDSVLVPDFVGKTMEEATELLIEDMLQYEESGGGNTIISQWPKAGTMVDPGSFITLYTDIKGGEVSTVPVPDVMGKTYDDALSVLMEKGFGVVLESTNTEDRVVNEQTPAAGQHVAPGSDVVLGFGRPPEPETEE